VAARLIARGDRVVVCDNLSRDGAQANLDWLRTLGEFAFERTDVRNADDVLRLVTRHRPRVVFHLAGQVAMTTSMRDPRLDCETNAMGSFTVLAAVGRC